jgi:hypothetical protein
MSCVRGDAIARNAVYARAAGLGIRLVNRSPWWSGIPIKNILPKRVSIPT